MYFNLKQNWNILVTMIFTNIYSSLILIPQNIMLMICYPPNDVDMYARYICIYTYIHLTYIVLVTRI